MQTEDYDKPVLGVSDAWNEGDWEVLGVQAHPVAQLPDVAWLRTHSLRELLAFLEEREAVIHEMEDDPARHGFEPRIWRVLDAICGFPWIEHSVADIAEAGRDEVKRAQLLRDNAWCLAVRRKLLGQDEAVRTLLLNGGNRGGKSEWAASRVMRLLLWRPRRRAWCLNQIASMSVKYQQPTVYKYFPRELKSEKGVRKGTTYIAFKMQTGFPDGSFVLPNGSDNLFFSYEDDAKKIEGGELDIIWCDELVPASWVKTLKARTATRNGWLLITFTPVEGYSATVKLFLDVARVTRQTIAYTNPKDGKPPLLDLALAGDNPEAWLTGERSQPEVPKGREFELVPRVMCCPRDRQQAVVFLHSWDNAFGNPRELYARYSGTSAEEKLMRFYGVATKQVNGQFPKFQPVVGIHLFRLAQMPKGGTRFHVVDPCSGRNLAMIWALVEQAPCGRRIWVYREWPCPKQYVPGVGDMGDWAISGEKLDGERGPAQRNIGWGVDQYIAEICRVEGRERMPDRARGNEERLFRFDEDDEPEYRPLLRRKHRPEEGEEIEERIMDSRYAASPSLQREGQTTLLEVFAEAGMDFVPASGRNIDEGSRIIDSLLWYDPSKPLDPLGNCPRLLIEEGCANTIFALQNWTGADGQHGACKDFVDLLRYLVLHDPDDYARGEGDQEDGQY